MYVMLGLTACFLMILIPLERLAEAESVQVKKKKKSIINGNNRMIFNLAPIVIYAYISS